MLITFSDKIMETLLGSKFRIARKATGSSQTDASKETDWNQTSISELESGVQSMPPPRYLSWLAKKHVNLTALFDESVSASDFQQVCDGVRKLSLMPHIADHCEKCESKDKEIGMLNRMVTNLERTVTILERGDVGPRRSAANE